MVVTYTATWYLPPPEVEIAPSPKRFPDFWSVRKTADGRPIWALDVDPVGEGDGWHRLSWLAFNRSRLPEESDGRLAQETQCRCDWRRAWYGCKVEALYSIMCAGQLVASLDGSCGFRFFQSAPGVNVLDCDIARKPAGYSQWVPLFQGGNLWRVKYDVYGDRTHRRTCRGADQWFQQNDGSVCLAGLWLQVRPHSLMVNSDEAQEFNPLLSGGGARQRQAHCPARRPYLLRLPPLGFRRSRRPDRTRRLPPDDRHQRHRLYPVSIRSRR